MPPADDWAAIADAARIDALCCAYAALRMTPRRRRWSQSRPAAGLRLTMPADANLRERVAATLARLRAEGAISI